MHNYLDILGWIFIFAGMFFIITSSVGLLRFPDFYTRLHPAGIADSLGAPMVLLGLACLNGINLFSLKYIILVIFLFITGPTATHIVAKAAHLSGLKPYKKGSNK